MSVLVPGVCLALVAAFLGAVMHPILTTRQTWRRATGRDRARLELTERKEQLFASIRELEFDHALGKISDADCEGLRAGLEAEAAQVLRHLDGLDGQGDPADLEARVEADVAARRGAPAAAVAPASSHGFCFRCGQPRAAEYRFCPHCGQAFPEASTN